jgi:hypothetical protein
MLHVFLTKAIPAAENISWVAWNKFILKLKILVSTS